MEYRTADTGPKNSIICSTALEREMTFIVEKSAERHMDICMRVHQVGTQHTIAYQIILASEMLPQ